MRRTLTVAIAVTLNVSAASAQAVMLSARGTGQVLIYPYYTVNHFQTLLSVVNATANGKAVKVRFREGYDGRDVVDFNVYLAPFDTWVGAVYDTSSDGTGAAAIGTNDNSCTVPAFGAAPFAGGPPTLPFGNENYTLGGYGMPTGIDSGPTGLARTREGFFEIIEMGTIVAAPSATNTLKAITAVNGKPPGCARVQNAWATGGYWTANAQTDLSPPSGGLYGSAGIVDVAQGTLYAYDATAIDGFSDVAQHTAPGDAKPNLSTAVTDSAHQITSAYVAIAYVGSPFVKADYPAARGVDAVSALLAADNVYNEFLTDPKLGANTDFLVTFPTKQFYVDPAIVGTKSSAYIQPFEEVFGGGLSSGHILDPGESCFDVAFAYVDREATIPPPPLCPGVCPITYGNYLCFESQVITFNQNNVVYGITTAVLRSLLGANIAANWNAGWFDLSFPDPGLEDLRPALDSRVFHGLPAVGFIAINYINANVTPGVLSNYSGTYPHRTDTDTFCTSAALPVVTSGCQQ